jgi:putative transport protein
MPREFRIFISRIRREGKIIDPEPGTVVHRGDVIAVLTRTEVLMEKGTEIGPEINDKPLIDFPAETLDR